MKNQKVEKQFKYSHSRRKREYLFYCFEWCFDNKPTKKDVIEILETDFDYSINLAFNNLNNCAY
jgi:hypothetical protein